MKKNLIIIAVGITALFLSSCNVQEPLLKKNAYAKLYEEKPLSVLIMPPVNRSTNVEAKEYFHSTLLIPLANAGYYVIPPFLSMEMLKRESAYDAEMFLEQSLNKFGNYFGADMVLFTIINKWDKSALAGKVYIDIEYILKSTKTNEVLYSKVAHVTYDTSVSSNSNGLLGVLVDVTASAISTAVTQYIDVARSCNSYALRDIPVGAYSSEYEMDGEENATPNVLSVTLQ